MTMNNFPNFFGANPPSFSFADATPASIQRDADEIKDKFNESIKSIKKSSSSSNALFTSLSLALGKASEASARVTLPSMVHADAEVRAASNAAKDELKNMFDAALSDKNLYKTLIESIQGGDGRNSNHQNGKEDTRFQHNIIRTLRRNGCGLGSESDQAAVQVKRQQIEDACTAFCATINENDGFLLFTDEDLDGLDDLDRFSTDETTGKRRLGLKAPDTLPVLKFAIRSNTRKKVFEALSKKCQEENTPRFLEVLELRDDCAKLLGYDSHAQFMCETKMVKSAENAEEFLTQLVDSYEPKRKEEMELLLDMKIKDVGNNDDKRSISLDPWDIAYYTRMYKTSVGVDEAALRSYFPMEHVKSTIFSIYEELLGLKFERVLDAEVWNEDVECYAVHSASCGGVLGHFYLDIFPRKGKYSHQCVYPLRPSYNAGKDRILPACVNIGNLTPSREGSPSLLMFREVETFFHEFGHACHCVLTNSQHSLHSWAWSAVPWPGGVEQDFLEVPSMMLENFVWCQEVILRLSKHVSNGSCLPESTIEALSKSRFLMTGCAKSKYLAMSMYDIKVHSKSGPFEFQGKEYDAVTLYNVMIEYYTGIAPMPNSFSAASWFHLLMGYDAGYYGYIYSETFAADLFSKFSDLKDKSVIDVNLGMKYRDTILSPCATVDGGEMLFNFLGREASNDAFLSRS